MKKILPLLLLVSTIAWGQATDNSQTTLVNTTIRNITLPNGITKGAVSDRLQNLIDSKVSRGELITASGTNSYSASGNNSLSYSNNFLVLVKFTNANSGASTLNINGLGAKAIKKNSSTALASGDIIAGQIFLLNYDGTNFQLIGASSSGGGITNGAAANELMKSDGTNAVASGLSSTTAGNLTFGLAATTGVDRTLLAAGSGSDINLNLLAKGAGAVQLGNSSWTNSIYTFGNQALVSDVKDASTNTVLPTIRGLRRTSGSAAVGIGSAIQLETISSAGSIIESVSTDLTGGSVDFDLVFKNIAAGASAAEKLRITSEGRLYGTALHNNSGSVTGTTNQYIASGTYTPTLTNTTNVAASTPYLCQWIRVGNVVTVSGKVDIDITTTLNASDMGFSLPIASAFTNERDAGGTATTDAEQTGNIRIKADATNDRAQFVWTGQVGTGNLSYSFTFTYLIL